MKVVKDVGLSRRALLKGALGCALLPMVSSSRLHAEKAKSGGRVRLPRQALYRLSGRDGVKPVKEASYCEKLGDDAVRCLLCFKQCRISPLERGWCGNRENRDGKLYSLVYGRPSALQLDPVEKEPCYHMMPGAVILCTGTAGCNYECRCCHNWHLSQFRIEQIDYFDLPPEGIAAIAKQYDCMGVSFTYNEPTVFYELMFDVMKTCKAWGGFKTLFHTNGSLSVEPLRELLKITDAVTVDLKGFREELYKSHCSGKLQPTLDFMKEVKKTGRHLEIVDLVIPGRSDDLNDIREMCRWVKRELCDEVPMHFNRFFPAYKLQNLPPTPVTVLEQAHAIAVNEVGLKYVYVGNVPGHPSNSTFCPHCKKRLIHRLHFEVVSDDVVNGRCRFCGCPIPGIWV
jgi:pyruvate formate lyase activating enzyme